jgi:hemoglobin
MTTLFEKAGGEAKLREVIRDFYDAVFSDLMIGFFFRRANKERLIQKELELISEHFGGPMKYTGREMREAHKKHPIMGGQFERRLQILRETMQKHALPEEVQAAWVAHARSLQSEVTPGYKGPECD